MLPMNTFISENQEVMNDYLSRVAVAAQDIASQGKLFQNIMIFSKRLNPKQWKFHKNQKN